MKVKAKVSFSGILTMSKGQTADMPENETLEDLMNAGYVEAVEDDPSVSKADISPFRGEKYFIKSAGVVY